MKTVNIAQYLPNTSIVLTVAMMVYVQVTVGRILRALVTMQGLVIEWVTIKAFHEDFNAENGKVYHEHVIHFDSFRRSFIIC